jgi:hypothetical protein
MYELIKGKGSRDEINHLLAVLLTKATSLDACQEKDGFIQGIMELEENVDQFYARIDQRKLTIINN